MCQTGDAIGSKFYYRVFLLVSPLVHPNLTMCVRLLFQYKYACLAIGTGESLFPHLENCAFTTIILEALKCLFKLTIHTNWRAGSIHCLIYYLIMWDLRFSRW
jgi:hypothetical protein